MKTIVDKKSLINQIKDQLNNNSNLKQLLFDNHIQKNTFQLQVICKCGKNCGVNLACQEYFNLEFLIKELLAFEE